MISKGEEQTQIPELKSPGQRMQTWRHQLSSFVTPPASQRYFCLTLVIAF